MLRNRTKDMTPFRGPVRIKRQNPFLLRLIWAVSYIAAGGKKCKIERIDMEGVKPPFLVLSEHQGFPDYYLTPLALYPHRATYVSDIEGFAAYGKWFYSQLGSVGTRRFTHDVNLVQAICQVTKENKDIIVIYPEACHSSVGVNKPLPDSIGKLAKMLGIPVVVQKMHGSYLTSPVWDEEHTRKVPLSVSLYKVLDSSQLKAMSAIQITEAIRERFAYDEYQWQYQNKVAVTYPNRAHGLHRVLYQCPVCKAECGMTSHAEQLHCLECGKMWQMDEYGRLHADQGKTEFPHIPDWYRFQRNEVERQIRDRQYRFREQVRVEALPSEKGFVVMGNAVLEHTPDGFLLTFEQDEETIFFKHRYALHLEYNYRGKGDSIVLSTRDCCYYLYPLSERVNVTKVQFAAEYYYQTATKKTKEEIQSQKQNK